ncbi:11408_t:CDS:2 [Funneliformis geosporum]|uniref:11408_t:CDS:1 n=1 Tax=Funneliformis geosporum TaxID=1117311 RepID=A0A9W4T3C3_9GLOM|nr:11408_t:CDS:2 [Funneliformis geosporum]
MPYKNNQLIAMSRVRIISILQSALAGNAWTKEKPKSPCRLVIPNVQPNEARIPETVSLVPNGEKQDESQEDRNIPSLKNPLMLVEMIANKKDRKRVANHFNRDGRGVPSTYCFGRVFEWDSMCNVLWSLGNYLSVASKESPTRRLIWGLEYDGTVTEFEDAMDDLPNEITFDKPATKTIDIAKKKKNSKKKQH